MNINQFITHYAIRPADAIVMRKKLFGMVDHYVIYVGIHDNRHRFVANYTKGVRDITPKELNDFLSILEPTKIDRFPGAEHERDFAVRKAVSRVGEKAYNYLSNNCEHFKNWVHNGVHKSEQVEGAAKAAVVGLGAVVMVGLFSALFSKD